MYKVWRTKKKKHKDWIALSKYSFIIMARNNHQSVFKICLFKIMRSKILLKCTLEKWWENFQKFKKHLHHRCFRINSNSFLFVFYLYRIFEAIKIKLRKMMCLVLTWNGTKQCPFKEVGKSTDFIYFTTSRHSFPLFLSTANKPFEILFQVLLQSDNAT